MKITLTEQACAAHNMCKLKGDAMLDNRDCSLAFNAVYDERAQAEQALAYFTEKAQAVQTEPCQISHHIQPLDNGYLLEMQMIFCCQAEVVLFQMAIR